jgi:hypothetical protein
MFKVTTHDVDHRSSRRYRKRESAIKRFEEMLGRKIETSIDEHYHATPADKRPTRETLKHVRDVSDYGTVVIFQEVSVV